MEGIEDRIAVAVDAVSDTLAGQLCGRGIAPHLLVQALEHGQRYEAWRVLLDAELDARNPHPETVALCHKHMGLAVHALADIVAVPDIIIGAEGITWPVSV